MLTRILPAVVFAAAGIALVVTSAVSASPSDEPGGDSPPEPTEIEPPQDPPPVVYPGTYTGTNTLSASGLVFTTPEGSGTANLDFDGTFDLTIADDLTSQGRFILGGLWGMEISPAVIDGSSSGAGTLEGFEDELVAVGEETTVFTVSVGGVGGSSFSGTDALPEASFRISVASCSELQGTWERAWQAIAAGVGYTNSENLFGDFWGIRTSFEEDQKRIDEFFRQWESSTPEQQETIDVSGLPPVLVKVKGLQQRNNDLFRSSTADSGPEWLALIDDAAQLSEEIRNTDPCALGGRARQQGDWTIPSDVVRNAFRANSDSPSYYDDASMRGLAGKALEFNVVGPRSASPAASAEVTESIQGWVDASVSQAGEPSEAVDALVVASALGLSVSPSALDTGGEGD